MRRIWCITLFAVLLLSVSRPAHATTIVIDFESLVSDLDSSNTLALTTQIPSLTFSNALVMEAESTLGEDEFPPKSGSLVVMDDGGPMTIEFASPFYTVGGYFTYVSGLTLQAFDMSNVLLGSISGSAGNNMGLSGDPGSSPNELLSIMSSTPIVKLVITGSLDGSSFVLDDLTLDDAQPAQNTPVPEPATLTMVLGGAAVLARRRWKQNA